MNTYICVFIYISYCITLSSIITFYAKHNFSICKCNLLRNVLESLLHGVMMPTHQERAVFHSLCRQHMGAQSRLRQRSKITRSKYKFTVILSIRLWVLNTLLDQVQWNTDWEVMGSSKHLPGISLLCCSLWANYVMSPYFTIPSSSIEEEPQKQSFHGCLNIKYKIMHAKYLVFNWISN